MITAAPTRPHPVPAPTDWRQAWRDAVRDPRELLDMLGLGHLAAGLSDDAAAQFPLRVPRGFIARMRHGDPQDPLLRQGFLRRRCDRRDRHGDDGTRQHGDIT